MLKIDIHIHSAFQTTQKTINGTRVDSYRDHIENMRQNGIDKSIVMSMNEFGEHFGNEECFCIYSAAKECFYYFANFDLLHEEELYRRVIREKERGAIGAGELMTRIAFDDRRACKLYEILMELKMPLLFHMSPNPEKFYGLYDEPSLPRLERMLSQFKDLIFIGHSQPFWFEMAGYDHLPDDEERNSYPNTRVLKRGRLFELLDRYENLYVDVSANSGSNAFLRDEDNALRFLKRYQDRILYGSDYCNTEQVHHFRSWFEHQAEVEMIDKVIYEKIMGKNAQKMIERIGYL